MGRVIYKTEDLMKKLLPFLMLLSLFLCTCTTGLGEECGVFGAYDMDGGNVAPSIYYGLFALQHRGQESCGIAVSDTEGPKGVVQTKKGMGLVHEVFEPDDFKKLKSSSKFFKSYSCIVKFSFRFSK